VIKKREKDDDRYRNAEKPKQDSAAHIVLPLVRDSAKSQRLTLNLVPISRVVPAIEPEGLPSRSSNSSPIGMPRPWKGHEEGPFGA